MQNLQGLFIVGSSREDRKKHVLATFLDLDKVWNAIFTFLPINRILDVSRYWGLDSSNTDDIIFYMVLNALTKFTYYSVYI